MLSKLRRLASIALAVLSVTFTILAVVGCQPAPKPTATPRPSPIPVRATLLPTPLPLPAVDTIDPNTSATLRLISVIKTPLDVYLEGAQIASALAYGAPTDPVTFAPKTYTLRILTTGLNVTTTQPLATQTITLTNSQAAIGVLYGSPDKPLFTLFTVDISTMPAKQARLAFAEFLPDSGTLNVNADLQTLLTLSSIAQMSTAVTQPITLQTLTFVRDTTPVATKAVALIERQSYLVLLLDPTTVLVVGLQTRGETQVRALQASSALDTVDVLLNGQPLAEGLAYGKNGEWQHLITRQYTLSVYKAGADRKTSKPLYSALLELTTDATSDLVLFADGTTIKHALVDENLTPVDGNFARLMIINAAAGANNLQTSNRGSPVDSLGQVDYTHSSTSALFGAGEIALSFQALDQASPRIIELKAPLTVEVGKSYVYVVTGTTNSIPPIVLITDVGVSTLPTATPTGIPAFQVRFINALSDKTTVDLVLDNQALFKNVQPGSGTPFTPLPSQSNTVLLRNSGSQTMLDQEGLRTINTGTLLMIAIGTAQSAKIVQIIDNMPPNTSNAVIDFVHAAPAVTGLRVDTPVSAPNSSISIDQPTGVPTQPVRAQELIAHLMYGDFSTMRTLTPGIYTLVVHDGSTNAVLGQVDNVQIDAERHYDILIVPSGGSTGSPLIPIVITSDPPPVS